MILAYNGNITDGVYLPVENIGGPDDPIYRGDTIEVERELGEALLSQTDIDPSGARVHVWAPADADAEQVVHEAIAWLTAVEAERIEAERAAAAERAAQAAIDAKVAAYRRELEAEADAARTELERQADEIDAAIAEKVAEKAAEVKKAAAAEKKAAKADKVDLPTK